MTQSPEHGVVAITGTYPISRELLGKIVDDVFDGAIEDASVIEQIYAAIKKHEPHPPKPGSRGIPVGEIVAASTPAAEILYGLDVKFYEALRSLPIGTQLYAASVDSAVDPQPSAENVVDDECDHKGKGLAVMSWGACCAGCGEPHPFDAPQPTVAITDGVVATPAPSVILRGDVYDPDAFMADGEIPMTAAENALAWLLVEKIGVVDDMNYSPKQAQDIIVAAIDDASSQLIESGEMLLKAEAVISDLTRLLQAAKEVIECASDTYKKRNGHRGSFEDDSGEKCWIVPFDAFEGLRSAVAAASEGSAE